MESRTIDAMPDDRRGLLTDREHEILRTDGADVTEKYYGVVVSRVRNKIDRLGDDLPALETHETLADELRAAVCEPTPVPETGTRDGPESQLRRLSNELGEPITVGETVYEDGDSHPLDFLDAPESGDESAERAPESVEGVDVDALDLPGRGEDLRRRQAAVRAVLAHLRENGEAQASDLRDLAWSVDGGTYGDAQSLWKNCVLAKALTPLDVAESAGPSGKWRWTGSESA